MKGFWGYQQWPLLSIDMVIFLLIKSIYKAKNNKLSWLKIKLNSVNEKN